MVLNTYKEDSSLNFTGKKYYEVFIFAVLMFEFAVLCPLIQNVNEWTITYYFLSYQDLGLNSRLFIGSIFKLFSEYISTSTIYICICVIITCMNAFIAVILGKALRHSQKDTLYSLEVFLVLFLASPVSLSFLYNWNNFGRLDTYLVIISIIMMLIIRHKYLKWMIPALCVVAPAIHQEYIMTFMPIIAIILIYECYKSRYKPAHIVLFFVSCLLVIFSSLYFQFMIPDLDFKNSEEVVNFLSHRTNFSLSGDVIFVEYFMNVDTWFYDEIQILKVFVIPYGLCMLAATSPLIAIFFSLWSKAYKKAEDKFSKFIILLCMTAPVISIPMFLASDWDRYIPMIFIVQFFLVFYFLDSGFPCVVDSAKNIQVYFQSHKLLFVFIIMFLSVITFSDAINYFNILMDRNIDFDALIAKYKILMR